MMSWETRQEQNYWNFERDTIKWKEVKQYFKPTIYVIRKSEDTEKWEGYVLEGIFTKNNVTSDIRFPPLRN